MTALSALLCVHNGWKGSAYIAECERDWTRHTSPCKPPPCLCCLDQRSLQRVSLTFPWSTGLVEKVVNERGHGVRQRFVMELVVLLRALDVVELDETAVR